MLGIPEKAGELMAKPLLITILLLSCCFSLAVVVEPKLAYTRVYARHDQGPVEVILGDARRMFAGHFFIKADAYFHSGYYPSIFDQAGERDSHLATGAGAVEEKHEHEADFLGKPLDWIDRFSRAFFPSSHSHLDQLPEGGESHGSHEGHEHEEEESAGNVREILPWLKIAADLDPNRVEIYTVGAYWLRTRMDRPKEAEQFLRDGLRANPGNYAILFELGRIYDENYHDPGRARNLWESALKHWNRDEAGKKDADTFLLLQICWQLALLEEKSGHPEKAIPYLQTAKSVSPHPEQVQARIEEVKSAIKGAGGPIR
jgi:tetratricopeptide (TPR) repeat protein